MKSYTLPLLLIGLLFAVPALSQGEKKEDSLEKKVEALEKKVAEQEASIDKLNKRVEAQKKASADLAKRLKAARKGGFTYPAPNIDAREALLGGLEAYAGATAE
ncbi:MAG: hypothetical protein ACYTHK_14875 [Planctomycetota bacterium]|jgi:septal ring factor EnvC (AmiA/AmiB activator)